MHVTPARSPKGPDGRFTPARRSRHIAVGAVLLIGIASVALAALPPGGTFVDDDGNFHEANIEAIVAAGITQGCDSSLPLYCPGQSVSRAQMATFLARALDLPIPPGNRFDDVSGIHLGSINAIAEAGITVGCNPAGTLFCPDDPVTRAQMATFLARALALSDSDIDFFSDDDANLHETNINAVAAAGITQGCEAGLYCPNDDVRRDRMATFMTRSLGLDPIEPPPPTTIATTTSTTLGAGCHPSYEWVCVPDGVSDVDCLGGTGNGPYYVEGPIRVVGPDVYGLDRDDDGYACEPSGWEP